MEAGFAADSLVVDCVWGVAAFVVLGSVDGGVLVGTSLGVSLESARFSAVDGAVFSVGSLELLSAVGAIAAAVVDEALDGCGAAAPAPGARGRAMGIFGLKAMPAFFLNMELMMAIVSSLPFAFFYRRGNILMIGAEVESWIWWIVTLRARLFANRRGTVTEVGGMQRKSASDK